MKGAVTAAVLAAMLILWRAAGLDPATAALERDLLDLRFRLRGPLPPPQEVVIVAIDEAALSEIGAYAPMRAAIARALGIIADAGPRAIAVDMLLVEETGADAGLAAALDAAAPVLIAVAATDAPGAPGPGAALERSAFPVVVAPADAPAERGGALILPHPRFAAAAQLAHVNVQPGTDGAVRAIPLAIPLGEGRYLPSMALAAAAGGAPLQLRRGKGAVIGDRLVPTDAVGRFTLDHYGGPGRIATVGLLDVLGGAVPAAAFEGRAVFIGSTAASLRDDFANAFGAGVAGVEILATGAANIIEGRAVRRGALTFWIGAALGLAGALLTLAAHRLSRPPLALAAAGLVWAAALGALHLAFAGPRLWIDAVAVIGCLAIGTGIGSWRRLRDERRRRANLARYVAPALAERLAEAHRPDFDRRAQTAGVLFGDVEGYSTLVETAAPTEVARFLTELHSHFEEAAARHGGIVVDYLGDGAMLVFGLPDAAPDDAARALACGRALIEGSGAIRAEPIADRIALRVSVHAGPVAAAVLGGRRHGHVGVTGDTVNLAARLQDVAKAHGAAFVTTRATLDAAGSDAGFAPLATERVRGRSGEVEVWQGLTGKG